MLPIQDGDSAALGVLSGISVACAIQNNHKKNTRPYLRYKVGPWPAKSVAENGRKLPWTLLRSVPSKIRQKAFFSEVRKMKLKATRGILGGMSQTDVEQMPGQFLQAL